jgi:hypothetical protein
MVPAAKAKWSSVAKRLRKFDDPSASSRRRPGDAALATVAGTETTAEIRKKTSDAT